jgi:ankyrin repeat protein
VAIGNQITNIDGMTKLIDSFVAGKSYNPNQQVLIGYSLPLIYFVVSLKETTSLQKLLEDINATISIETSLGNTPMHIAAINSIACLKLLIKDGRLDVNEHNYEGKTPLYVAMECNHQGSSGIWSHQDNIEALLASDRIRINSRDNRGRTMLHIAVISGDTNVVTQILKLTGQYGTDNQRLEVNITDDRGKTPADYLEYIKNENVQKSIQILLAALGTAKYGTGYDNHTDSDGHGPSDLVKDPEL